MSSSKKSRLRAITGLIILIMVMWVIAILNIMTNHGLLRWGIFPRSTEGLTGIPVSPFLHYGFEHLITNIVPLLIFGIIIAILHAGKWWWINIGIIGLSGILVWLFGRPAYHIGASGLVFGYFGFLVFAGIYTRRMTAILLSIVIVVLYGGMIWGIVPGAAMISWESHLFGLISGILMARILLV